MPTRPFACSVCAFPCEVPDELMAEGCFFYYSFYFKNFVRLSVFGGIGCYLRGFWLAPDFPLRVYECFRLPATSLAACLLLVEVTLPLAMKGNELAT